MQKEGLVAAYCADLNAIHEATLQLSAEEYAGADGMIWSQRCEFMRQLELIVSRDAGMERCNFQFYNATAAQRCEAILKTIGKWQP